MPLRQSLTTHYLKCRKHPTKQCELHCEQCDILICAHCISSGDNLGHKQEDIFQNLNSKKEILRKDLEELENFVFPRYQELAHGIQVQKADLDKTSGTLKIAFDKQGEVWHREIDDIIKSLKFDLDKAESKTLTVLCKQEGEINRRISEIKHNIATLKQILSSKDASVVFSYSPRNAEFRRLPVKLKMTLPNFTPHKINKDQLRQQFGSLSASYLTTEKYECPMTTKEIEPSLPERSLMDVPQITVTIDTRYQYLYNVTCLNDKELWSLGNDKIMKLYNLNGKLLKSIKTRSGNTPQDITVTKNGDLAYADHNDSTVNIIKNDQIHEAIRLRGWRPLSVCSVSAGDDILVIMTSDDYKQTKVVRYSGSEEKQSFQSNDKEQPLFSSGLYNTKYITENKNLDICVCDTDAGAVVALNKSGKLWFKYTGQSTQLPSTKRPFNPHGIATDSRCRILTADYNNKRIHILDFDGAFLRYINNCELDHPCYLCVDTRDNLFVAERSTSKAKKIQYYK